MKRNKPGAMPEITRTVYKDIKRYDRQQMYEFCRDMYGFGFEDGVEAGKASVQGITAERAYEILTGVKGIGAKRLEEIKARLDAEMEGGHYAGDKM